VQCCAVAMENGEYCTKSNIMFWKNEQIFLTSFYTSENPSDLWNQGILA